MPQWKIIPQFPKYRVSDTGLVESSCGKQEHVLTTWRPIQGRADGKGYLRIQFGKHGPTKSIHSLVLEAFVGPCPTGLVGCHKDNNKLNNCVGNLRWGTQQSNMADKVQHGTNPEGVDNPMSKLTKELVLQIRELRAANTIYALAKRFGVHPTTISQICLRKRWKHI